MVYGYEVRAGRECALDHEFCKGRADGREDMAAAKHGCADGHEVCDCVVPIADELYSLALKLMERWGSILLEDYWQ